MYGVTRAPFNSNRSSCGIEVVVPLFIPPEIRNTVRGIPFQCTQTDLWRPSGRRKRSGGRYYPRPDRNSLDAGEPPARSMNFKILKVRSRASCGLEILSSLLATACEVSE